MNRIFSTWIGCLLVTGTLVTLPWLVVPGYCADNESACAACTDRWKALVGEVSKTLKLYKEVKDSPLGRIVKGPLVDRNSGKTIAEQIAGAIRIKEEMLKEKREIVRKAIKLEQPAFTQLESCLKDGDRKQKRALKRLTRERKRLIKRSVITIAEVQAVEGREQYSRYVDSSQQYYGGNGGGNGYWNAYRRMYNNYWRRR
ncbi:hypothetical protein ACFL2Q_05605 [Thermodesulfobacteriota bacterium]